MYRFSLSVLLLFCLFAAFGQSQERIIRFHSDIRIETDGRIEVAEHINVFAAGNEIKRGIVREIPLYRKNIRGKRVRMDYNVLTVNCNGGDAKYSIIHENGKLAIYIGDADVLLEAGEYDYTVVYESYGHVGFFDGFDELYWNVTGNDWIFSIEKASATITLPGNANALHTACYTGVQGSTGKDCSVEEHGSTVAFTANRRLAPREGLTVAVAFPDGIIARPPPPTKAQAFWDEHNDKVCALSGLLICFAYCFFSLRRAGKQSIKPVVIPAFKPPRNLSPASVRYLATQQYDGKAFSATLVEMAVKGAMNIRHIKKKKYSLVNKMNTERLRPEERQAHATVFANSETVEVSQKNWTRFSKASDDLKKSLENQWNVKDYFLENRGYVAIGGVILNMVLTLYVLLTGFSEEVLLALFAASPFIAVELLFLFSVGLNMQIGCKTFGASLIILFLLVGFVATVVWDDSTGMEVHWLSAGFFAASSVIYAVYARRIRVFTAEGIKLASELEGFKMYMKTAEEHRLNILTPPERTPELFEKLLPYAIALNVSNEWCKKFDDVLKRINYRPEWYDAEDKLYIKGFTTTFATLSTTFSSSVSAAQSNPASSSSSSGSGDWSSGSSGSGYSGGGGGGGGGRGW